jgi:NAD/NADP transhydrogenase beta subunit
MLAVMPRMAIGAGDLMAAFLLMSGLAMLIIVLTTWLYVASVNAAGTSRTIEITLAVTSFVLSKLWVACLLPVVALCNGIGGGAVSAVAAMHMLGRNDGGTVAFAATLVVALIGVVSLSGSLTVWSRLNGFIRRPLGIIGQRVLALVLAVMLIAVGGYVVFAAAGVGDGSIVSSLLVYSLFGSAVLLGIFITIPIQNAQMPAMLYFFNALIGLAIGLEGLVLGSLRLMIAGLLVGTARVVLTLPIARISDRKALGNYGDLT